MKKQIIIETDETGVSQRMVYEGFTCFELLGMLRFYEKWTWLQIERDIEKIIPDLQTPIVVYCSGGFRCALVADSLQHMGYSHVFSLESGMQGWLNANYSLILNEENNRAC